MKRFILSIFSLILLMYPLICTAHGVRGEVGSGGIVVSAQYDTGEPMSYAKVQISAPDSKIPFQLGRTDRNGYFCFFPDISGKWNVIVDDEMGHRLELIVPVNKALELKLASQEQNNVSAYMSTLEKIITGFSLIFGIFGIFFYWKGRRELKIR